jgi:acylphosphatase
MVTANWTSLDSPTADYTQTNPSVGKNDDGRLEVFTVASDNTLWHRRQTTPGVDWGNWASLGQPLPGLNGYTAVAANQDGRLEVFGTGIDGALWHIWQGAPNGTWSTWNSLGNPTGVDLVLSMNVHVNTDGRLEIFMAGSDNALWHIWQVAPNRTWSTWKSLGTPPGTNSISYPVASENADGRLEAFVIGSDNALWHIWQATPAGSWGGWSSLAKPPVANAFFVPFVRKNDDGRLEVFTVGTDGTLWHIWQVAPNRAWSNWASLGNPPTANVQSPPSVRKNKDGRLEAFSICSDGALWHIAQVAPGSVWGSWDSLGTPSKSVILSAGPIVVENTDGRLEAFVGGSDNALWHTWQVSPGGNWSS